MTEKTLEAQLLEVIPDWEDEDFDPEELTPSQEQALVRHEMERCERGHPEVREQIAALYRVIDELFDRDHQAWNHFRMEVRAQLG